MIGAEEESKESKKNGGEDSSWHDSAANPWRGKPSC